MTFRVRIRPDAERDMLDAARYYESRALDLGLQFLKGC